MTIYGKPGAYATHLVTLARMKQLKAIVVAIVAVAAAGGLLWWGAIPWWIPVVAAVGAFGFSYSMFHAAGIDAGKAGIGARKEYELATLLARSGVDGTAVFGLQLGKSRGSSEDVDCVVAVPGSGVFSVEIKTGFGEVAVLDDGRIRAGKRIIPGDPAAQATRGASDVARMFSADHVFPVVAISDGTCNPLNADAVIVVPSATVPMLVASPMGRQPFGVVEVERRLVAEAKKQGKRDTTRQMARRGKR